MAITRFSGLCFAACFAIATPGHALPMKAVYTGTIYGSFDETSLFGAGTNLDGLSYSLAFFFDPETLGSGRITTPTSDSVSGGSFSGNTSPVSKAVLTIAGHAEIVSGAFQGLAVSRDSYYSEHTAHNVFFDGVTYTDQLMYNSATDLDFTTPVDLQTAFATTLTNGFGAGYFGLFATDVTLGQTVSRAYGNMTATGLTITALSTVPLPAGLPLLLAGLGVLGLTKRPYSRTRLTAPLAADVVSAA